MHKNTLRSTVVSAYRGALLSASLVLLPACPGLGDMMRAYGYVELANPSTLLSPGAMVSIVNRNPFKAKLICGPRASLGPNWQPQSSATVTRVLSTQSTKTFRIGANFMEQITGDVRFNAIRDITATLTNATIVELEDTDILANLKYRSQECEEAVNLRVKNGFPLTMISSGLMGDITYSVKWDTTMSLDAKAKVAQLEGLAVELGAGNSCIGEDTIRATGLTYGIRDDAYLGALTLTEIDETQVVRGSRIIPIDETANVDLEPDAPIVKPPGDPACEGTKCDSNGGLGHVHDVGIVPIQPRVKSRVSSMWD